MHLDLCDMHGTMQLHSLISVLSCYIISWLVLPVFRGRKKKQAGNSPSYLKKRSACWLASKIPSSLPKSSDFYTVTCGLITPILVCILAVKLAKWLLFVSIDNYRIITDDYVFCDNNHRLSMFSKLIIPSHSPLVSWFLYFQENNHPKTEIRSSTFSVNFERVWT